MPVVAWYPGVEQCFILPPLCGCFCYHPFHGRVTQRYHLATPADDAGPGEHFH